MYPGDLVAVPENAKIAETFGWSLLSWACVLVVWCSVLFTQPAKPSRNEYVLAAITFMVALGLVLFEFHRRKNRRVLVRLPESPLVGIYRRGTIKRTVQVELMTLDLRYSSAALAAVLAPGSVAFGLAIFLLPGNIAISISERIEAGLGVLCFASLALSSVKTWWLCEVCLFPNEGNKRRERVLGPERILVRKRELPLLLNRQQKLEFDRSSAEKFES